MAPLLLFTGIGLALFACALAALWWTVRSGQLDDLDTPALRMLGEDLPADEAGWPRRQAIAAAMEPGGRDLPPARTPSDQPPPLANDLP